MPATIRLLVISLLLVGSLSAESTGWDRVKIGMSGDDVISLLGEPVFRRKGRGFETWTYDQGAEVLVYRRVVGWTAPASTPVPGPSQDVWSLAPKKADFYATLRAAVRQPAPKAVAAATAKLPTSSAGMGYEEYLQTYGRSKG